MNQGKLEVFKQEMVRVNVDILGISKLKWTGMGEFNSDNGNNLDLIPIQFRASLVAQVVKHLPAMWKTWVRSLSWDDSPGEGNGNLPQYILPGEFHGQRSLVGYSPWSHKDSGLTEWLTYTCTIYSFCLAFLLLSLNKCQQYFIYWNKSFECQSQIPNRIDSSLCGFGNLHCLCQIL